MTQEKVAKMIYFIGDAIDQLELDWAACEDEDARKEYQEQFAHMKDAIGILQILRDKGAVYLNTPKFRVVESDDSDDVYIVTEDGGVAFFYMEGDTIVTEYYKERITKDSIDLSELDEGAQCYKDWKVEPSIEEIVEDALVWLSPTTPIEAWLEDKTLFPNLWPVE